MKLTPRDYQNEGVQAAVRWHQSGAKGTPLIVVPTGGGKSLMAAELIRAFRCRALYLVHSKELIEQSSATFRRQTGRVPGLYSAGLPGSPKQSGSRVVFAGIQSAWRKAPSFGDRGLVIVDEAHAIPRDGMGQYRTFLAEMRDKNPGVAVIGLTATPFRTKGGLLTEGDDATFSEIIYEVPMDLLLERGYLCPLVSRQGVARMNTGEMRWRAGDFHSGDMEEQAIATLARALAETLEYAKDRKHVLIFSPSRKHARLVLAALKAAGQSAALVLGDISEKERERELKRFTTGQVKFCVNVGVLTTGFDFPAIDMVVLLRATGSPGLLIQMAGRGMRPHASKQECLLLDFGMNVERHGPVNDPHIKERASGGRPTGEMVCKFCPECDEPVPISSRLCPGCGYGFPAPSPVTHEDQSSEANPLKKRPKARPEVFKVKSARYFRHRKTGKTDSVRVEYQIDEPPWSLTEWVFPGRPGKSKIASRWWAKAMRRDTAGNTLPQDASEFLQRTDELVCPSWIRAYRRGRYWNVNGHMYDHG